MGALLDFSNHLEPTTCPACGVGFAMPTHLLKTKRENGESFFCPNGDSLSFKEAECARLKRELEAAKTQAEADRSRAERNWLRYRQTDGRLKALKQRAQNGVCPCCRRTFKQLAAHMKTKHPGYATQHLDAVDK